MLCTCTNIESSVLQRQCCGPGREFSMSITDNSNREVQIIVLFWLAHLISDLSIGHSSGATLALLLQLQWSYLLLLSELLPASHH